MISGAPASSPSGTVSRAAPRRTCVRPVGDGAASSSGWGTVTSEVFAKANPASSMPVAPLSDFENGGSHVLLVSLPESFSVVPLMVT